MKDEIELRQEPTRFIPPPSAFIPGFLWVVAQTAERRTVTAAGEGSTPFDPPNHFPV